MYHCINVPEYLYYTLILYPVFSVLMYHHHFVIGIFLGILCPCQCRRVAAAPMVQYPRVMCVATASIGSSRGWSRGHSWARPIGGPPSSPRLGGQSILSVLNPTHAGRLYRDVRYICSAEPYQLQVLFASGTTTLYFSYMYSELQVPIKCITWTSAVQYSELDTTLQCTTSQNCAIYIAMQRYWQRSVILSNIVTVRIRHGLTILGL